MLKLKYIKKVMIGSSLMHRLLSYITIMILLDENILLKLHAVYLVKYSKKVWLSHNGLETLSNWS